MNPVAEAPAIRRPAPPAPAAHGGDDAHGGHHEPESFWRRYVFSTDHKMIAKQYLFTGVFMALVGGFLAQLMRVQLASPGAEIPGMGAMHAGQYNTYVTMHGTTMIFWVAMPLLLGAFGNFLIPLMIGAKDMAFPRLNMLSYWTFALSTVVLLGSFFVPGGASPVGWTAYPPLSANPQYSGNVWGVHLWILAVALEMVAFLMGGINYITTAINLRAPGMRMKDLPLILWMQIVASVIFLFSAGPLVAGAVMLLLDRTAGTGFYNPAAGGDPLLFQHLFWFFGHPEVYVLLLPGLGIVAEILPVFSRKPVFGYKMILWSTIATGLLSFVVWAHHQFVSGIDPRLAAPFSLTTILISVPVAVTLFSFIATLWKGSIEFTTAMLFALGMIAVFLIGGVTGILNGSAAADIYIHDTYFVVAHFHYALIPPVFFGFFAGIYYWYPKMFGRMMNETLGKLHFWGTTIFVNVTFLPMFVMGLRGYPRRVYDPTQFSSLGDMTLMQILATVGTAGLLLSQVPLLINFFGSLRWGKVAGPNPWRANTLEWAAPSPPPHGNFAAQPSVYRWPYEYSAPGRAEDWHPQHLPSGAAAEGSRS
ncbi:MAG TPA: cbb3-type cytochrome c oxidase subunit I [Candidatus Eisenbacteria bacterium]|nr:cbb3-type cytochrome c oxidase subunit I [Candidatus Eisenbacteria bacterium]